MPDAQCPACQLVAAPGVDHPAALHAGLPALWGERRHRRCADAPEPCAGGRRAAWRAGRRRRRRPAVLKAPPTAGRPSWPSPRSSSFRRVPGVQDRVDERRRAVAVARHLRESEGLSNAQIGDRLGRSEATVKGYFYDPTGAKAKAVKARYQGACKRCGAPTQPRNGKGDAYRYCKACHPGAIQPRWTRAGCSRRCARGSAATGARRAPMTGRARMRAGAAAPRSRACRKASGRPPPPSATCSAAGRPRGSSRLAEPLSPPRPTPGPPLPCEGHGRAVAARVAVAGAARRRRTLRRAVAGARRRCAAPPPRSRRLSSPSPLPVEDRDQARSRGRRAAR